MSFPLECVCDCAGQCKATGNYMSAITHARCQEDARYRWRLSGRPRDEWPEELRAPPKPPGLFRTVTNFLGAVVQHVTTGGKSSSAAEKARRLEICGGCEYLKDGRCLKCNCVVSWKAGWLEQKCPIGKWHDDDCWPTTPEYHWQRDKVSYWVGQINGSEVKTLNVGLLDGPNVWVDAEELEQPGDDESWFMSTALVRQRLLEYWRAKGEQPT